MKLHKTVTSAIEEIDITLPYYTRTGVVYMKIISPSLAISVRYSRKAGMGYIDVGKVNSVLPFGISASHTPITAEEFNAEFNAVLEFLLESNKSKSSE